MNRHNSNILSILTKLPILETFTKLNKLPNLDRWDNPIHVGHIGRHRCTPPKSVEIITRHCMAHMHRITVETGGLAPIFVFEGVVKPVIHFALHIL